MQNFVLASQSPRRQELLKNLGIAFRVLPDHSPEVALNAATPAEIVMELAAQKARNVAPQCAENEVILSADTMVFQNGRLLGKPSDAEEAKVMLNALSGNTHEVYTGFCILEKKSGKLCTDHECTQVTFRRLSVGEIDRYIRSGEPMDKAGAYGIQGLGALFIEKINGDYFNVMGLPLCKMGKILNEEFGISIL